MIPKIIHYCWFGRNPLPPLALECIASWKKFLPDYEIREWNEDNFDVNVVPYTAEAYRQKKYAFVSDYARFWILYRYGGLYFDTDVEVIRPLDDIIEKGSFLGFETDPDGENSPLKYAPKYAFGLNSGLGCAFTQGHPFLQEMLNLYEHMAFENPAESPMMKTVVAYTTETLLPHGVQCKKGIQTVDSITLYPREYFAPINVVTGRMHITPNTRSIHRYMGSWTTSNKSIKDIIRHYVPEWALIIFNKINRRINKLHNEKYQ